jgi:hypothetical protein
VLFAAYGVSYLFQCSKNWIMCVCLVELRVTSADLASVVLFPVTLGDFFSMSCPCLWCCGPLSVTVFVFVGLDDL